MRRLLAPIVLATLLAPAVASVAVRATVEDLVDLAGAVVDGTVVDHATTLDAKAGAVWTTYRVRVKATLVGAPAQEIFVRVRGGRVGTIEQETIGAARLEDGERVVAFLGHDDCGAREVIGLAQGVFHVAQDPKTGTELCENSTDGLSLVDAAGAPASAGALRFTVADLQKRVAARSVGVEARRRAVREARDRRFAEWTLAALRHAELTRGRPGGADR